ncbi:protein tolB [Paenibacillus tengchongensis]|uniref:protein tolB n=1 Tax=Paenibacillus tengchongensis TaxID=2608684 RepID=UPI00124C3FFA|nr:protein tolB [Paenibacillus tengchongensis]
MNKIAKISVILFALISILGCNSNNSSNFTEPANQNNVAQTNSGSADPQTKHSFDPSVYSAPEGHPAIETSDNQIIWKEGDVVLTAAVSKAEGQQAAQANTVISAITVESGSGSHTIELENKPLGIQSVSVSNNQAAVHVRDHERSRLVILNLESGKQTVINDLTSDEAFREKVDSYNWSPDGNTIALGMGNLGSSYIALYNTGDDSLSKLSEQDYRLITSVVWHKDGQGFDFLSKTDDANNPTILYRYTLKDHKVSQVITNLKEEEQAALMELLPAKTE